MEPPIVKQPTSILITGASSGIGAALALAYAGPGVHLSLSGRNTQRLQDVATSCRAAGAEVVAETVDVADRAAMAAWLGARDDARPLDLVIANAGIDGSGIDEAERLYRIFDINVAGVFHTVQPALDRMRARRRGQIAIVSSLAGFRGLPSAVAYSASKAAVRSYGEGLRGRHAEDGVAISVICPGFVESRITATNKFPMPMLWPADKAARHIKSRLARNQGRIAFPWPMYFLVWLISAAPASLVDRLLARAPRKA